MTAFGTESRPSRVSDSEGPTMSDESGVVAAVDEKHGEPAELENAGRQKGAGAGTGDGPPPPPDGGVVAWLHVLGGFMLFFNSWGIMNAFAAFQTYYESGALFERSSSDISWIGSVQSALVLLGGVVAGPAYDRGYLRHLLCGGGFAVVFGHMMLSLCSQYWQVVLAQGVCVGLGAGMLFVPCVSILPTYFGARLGLAVGLASAGSSLGGVVYPVVLYRLLGRVGFAWSVRAVGFIALGTLAVPVAVMRTRVRAQRARSAIDWTAFRDAPYVAFTATTLLGFTGLAVLLFYFSYYSAEQGILDQDLAFYLVPVFNAASCFGRVLPNALSDRVGHFNVIAPCAVVTGVLMLCLPAAHSPASVIVIVVLAGFFSGVFIAMPPVCFFPLTQDKSKLGTRIGMGFAIIAIGLLVGAPVAGAILGQEKPLRWDGLWGFGGAATVAAGLLYAALRVYRSGFALNIKA